jgi:transcriptional regulator with XRE-family HTH domain
MTRALLTVGERLQELRLHAGLTQEALAARSGLSVHSIRGWEQDQRTPGLLAVYRIAQVMGLPMERFVEGVKDNLTPPPQKARGRKK